MLLDSTTRKLQLVLTSAMTTSNMPVCIYYVDDSSVNLAIAGSALSNSNGTSAVDILAAPQVYVQRKVNALTVNNIDTVAKTVKIYLDDNGTDYLLCAAILQVGDVLGYTDTEGWYTTDASGARKFANANYALVSGTLAQFAATSSAQLAALLSDETGTGLAVFNNSPTLVTPSLGAATATSINKVAITQPATGSTVTVADGKTLTASNTLTLTATDGATLAIGAGGTLASGAYAVVTGTNTGDQTSIAGITGTLAQFNTAITDADLLDTAGIGSNLTLSRIAGSTYSTIQHWRNNMSSAGIVGDGGVITDAGGGTINVSTGSCAIRPATLHTSTLYFADYPASLGLAIPTNTVRYVGIEYNAGSPIVALRSVDDFDYMTNIPLGVVTNEAGTLHINLADRHDVADSASHVAERLEHTAGYARDETLGGLILGETGTRNITMSAGALWQKLTKLTIAAFNSSTGGVFSIYYRDGAGGFTKVSSQTQWPNTQYDNGTGTLATLATNKYAVCWFYLEADDSDIIMLYGRVEHGSVAAAEAEAPPATLPNRVSAGARIIGKLVFQKSAATATSISSVFTTLFSTTGAADHSNLSNLDYAAAGHTGFQSVLTNSAGLAAALSDETGTGLAVFNTSPTLVTPALGTPSSGDLRNCSLAVAPAIGGTTPASGAFTALSSSGNASLGDSIVFDAHTFLGRSTFNDLRIAAISATLPAITIVDHCFHLERDDSPRARGWRRRKGQSWRSEARSLGRPLGSYATATAAVAAGAALTDFYYNTTNSRHEEITNVGTPASTVTYRAGKEDYPTNALKTVETARVIIWDLDGAVPSMWMVFVTGTGGYHLGVVSGLSAISCINGSIAIAVGGGGGNGLQVINLISDSASYYSTVGFGGSGRRSSNIAGRNAASSLTINAAYHIIDAVVNDVAITVLPDAPVDGYGMPIDTIAVATAGGVSEIQNDGTVKNSTSTGASYSVSYDTLGRIVWSETAQMFTSPVAPRTAGFASSSSTAPRIANAAYSSTTIPSNIIVGGTSGKSAKNALGNSNGLVLYAPNQSSNTLQATITSTYNTGYMVGDIRRAIGYDSASALADKSVKASTGIAEVGTLTKTPVSGGRTAVSGFSAANYIQEASHADWNARAALNFYDMLSGGKWGTVATLKTIISIGDGASNGSLKLEHLAANTLRLSIYNAGWTTICTSTVTFTDTAEHTVGYGRMTLAGVADTCFIAVDGVIVASAVSVLTISNATGYFRIGEGQGASQPWAGGQFSGYVRISSTAPSIEGLKYIAEQENALNSGHACLLSNSSSVSKLNYYNRSNMLAVGNGTNTDFFAGLAREGVVTTATGAIVSGTIPSEATFFATGTTNTLRVGERNVNAELTEQIPSIPKTQYYSFTSNGTTQALPQGWKARGVAFNLTDGTMLAVAQTFDGFIWTQTGLTTAKAYQVEIEEVL